MGKIKNMGSATMKFGEGIIISGSVPESALALFISGSTVINGQLHVSGSDQEGIRIAKGPDDYRQIVFETDGVDSANIHLSNAENLVIMNETNGKDIQFWVDSNAGGNIQAITIKETGKVGIGNATSPSTTLHVSASVSNEYVATIENDQNTNGHVLKLLTDGNGNGSNILEMEDGDGDTIFRARADGRFGFGPDGVDSMGAGTFVVGIDNSSHTSDIAISQRLQHLGDSNTYLDFPSNDTFNLVAGGNSFLKYDSGNILINNANANVDTKIMADDGNVVLHVDAGTNRVGVGTTAPNAALHVDGSFALKSREVTSFPYAVAADDYVVLVAGTGTPRRINLPAKSGQEGRILVIKDATGNAQSNNIELNPDGSENIDGSADKLLNTNRVAVTIICASDQWHIIGKYSG